MKLTTKLSTNLPLKHFMHELIPLFIGVGVIGFVTYFQFVAQVNKSAQVQAVSLKKVAPSKPIVKAPVSVSPVVTTSTIAPTRSVATVTTAPQPEPEPVVTPSPNSNVNGLTPVAPQPSVPISSSPPASNSTSPPSTPTSPPLTTTSYKSLNWSGYLAANSSYSGISASWVAPKAVGLGSSTSADATWIGIGGVTSGDLIQVGTQNIVTPSGQVHTSAFYELLPNASLPIPGVTVTSGDSISASLNELSADQWTIYITDKTTGESFTTTVSYTSSHSSADWIEEDPSYISGSQIPFDNFTKVDFTNALTEIKNSNVNVTKANAQSVTMVNLAGQPIAIPSLVGSDGASFSVARMNTL